MGKREAQAQMLAMQDSFRTDVREGRLSPNAMLPSARELGAQFGLSHMSTARVLQSLVEEGVLRSVPRVGYFVGASIKREAGNYLILSPNTKFWNDAYSVQFRIGFENRISKLGGSTLMMHWDTALQFKEQGNLPSLAGVFNMSTHDFLVEQGVPNVWIHSRKPQNSAFDAVSFDDLMGGVQATRHLLNLGHRRIAFLGLHTPEDGANDLRGQKDDGLMWSVERERGWKDAMCEAGLYDTELYFHPRQTAWPYDADKEHREAAYEFSLNLLEQLRSLEITAVIAVNGAACQGFLDAVQDSSMDESECPALLGFDYEADSGSHFVSTMRLPWHELGQTAADLLWERHHGTLRGATTHRAVPMRLIPRLSCRTDWNSLAMAS